MKLFKCRCSGIGQIMTNPKLKTAIYSETMKSYAENWIKEQIYGRSNSFGNKFTEKGTFIESASIDYYMANTDKLLLKNDKSFENEFITGTPDIITKEEVIDIKSSWDCFTFPLFENEIPTSAYEWQLQGYMALTGKEKAKLVYVLMDTPDHIITSETYSLFRKTGQEVDFEQIKDYYSYKDINLKYRIKVFELQRDEEKINFVYEKVKLVREYINSLNLHL